MISRYQTIKASLRVINRPNIPVNPARKTAPCICRKAFRTVIWFSQAFHPAGWVGMTEIFRSSLHDCGNL